MHSVVEAKGSFRPGGGWQVAVRNKMGTRQPWRPDSSGKHASLPCSIKISEDTSPQPKLFLFLILEMSKMKPQKSGNYQDNGHKLIPALL